MENKKAITDLSDVYTPPTDQEAEEIAEYADDGSLEILVSDNNWNVVGPLFRLMMRARTVPPARKKSDDSGFEPTSERELTLKDRYSRSIVLRSQFSLVGSTGEKNSLPSMYPRSKAIWALAVNELTKQNHIPTDDEIRQKFLSTEDNRQPCEFSVQEEIGRTFKTSVFLSYQKLLEMTREPGQPVPKLTTKQKDKFWEAAKSMRNVSVTLSQKQTDGFVEEIAVFQVFSSILKIKGQGGGIRINFDPIAATHVLLNGHFSPVYPWSLALDGTPHSIPFNQYLCDRLNIRRSFLNIVRNNGCFVAVMGELLKSAFPDFPTAIEIGRSNRAFKQRWGVALVDYVKKHQAQTVQIALFTQDGQLINPEESSSMRSYEWENVRVLFQVAPDRLVEVSQKNHFPFTEAEQESCSEAWKNFVEKFPIEW